ncbi:nucleotidyltransferase family protein [Gordonia insulae]|uniref:nucleotidyltransferase family protein n=1 Tax=Gordonia insulae TaxID=2420509 RepID=UPI001E2EF4A1|nr:NTP transferase domain-containing protein [Gordonia insulae]
MVADSGDRVVPTAGDDGGGVLGVVLAAGAGTRYGEPKIVARQGEWLENAVRALADGGCREVVVAMGARVVEPPAGASVLWVPDWADGLGATVRRAVGVARGRSWVAGMVLHVVDTPDVGAAVVERVVGVAARRRDVLARAMFGGLPGHPVYVGADHLDAMTETLHGDVGAGRYLAAHAADVLGVDCGDLASGRDRDRPN